MLIVYQSLVYFFKSFVLAALVALPTKLLRDGQIGSGVGMVNPGGQAAAGLTGEFFRCKARSFSGAA